MNKMSCLFLWTIYFLSKRANKHVNGIIRRFWKKRTDFSQLSCSEILDTQNKINKIPREIFNWKSSLDLFKKAI